ncbi:ABC transporter permease [Kineosporia sp. NBRC 101731]|uniref:ABC transporter permease n=1 Tax=Kineosporia sp. NBRC 101731 TaxID=3032199 RepID=UPI0024A1B677|nr:ABC transporter permease [Kineosporia sp. NBRC 101731]GLY28768.1 transport permease protein [Kineosporia sp. NBRC 101731]
MSVITRVAEPTEYAGPGVRERVRQELRAGWMVWRREMLHLLRDRTRVVMSLLQPFLFLLVLGVGLSRLIDSVGTAPGAGPAYLVFLFPGVLVMAVQAPAVSVGASIVWDRQSGFLREMLVAPVRRSTLLIGKCLGGATVAAVQGAVVLVVAGVVGVPYRLDLFLLLFAELLLASLVMTALGAVVAVTIQRMATFHTVLGALITPVLFLSGAMFPLASMPAWMAALAVLNPLTYVIDVMRRTVGAFTTTDGTPLAGPVTWAGRELPVALEVGLVVGFVVVLLGVAVRRFSRAE